MTASPPVAQPPKRKKHFLVMALLFMAIGGGLIALFLGRLTFLGEFLPSTSGITNNQQDAQINMVITYKMREPLEVVLNSGDDNRVYLKLKLSFKLSREQDLPFIVNLEPVIRDSLITYLQELRPEELQGSRGIFLLREEMLFRVNKITSAVRVSDVYITDMQLQ